MKETLTVALIQAELVWHDPEANKDHFSKLIDKITEGVDLIILPEMFTTGFSMSPETIAETMTGDTISWMKNIAQEKQLAIMGSIIISEEGNYFNRLLFVHPSGDIESYDKRHLFTLAGEDRAFKEGSQRLIVEYAGWKLCPMVCYDLRFPVWSRNTINYDALIYVANWPKPRTNAWDALLKARAIENMSYAIGVNRVGVDPKGREYIGHSACYDVLGEEMEKIAGGETDIRIVKMHRSHITEIREKLAFLNDQDDFTLQGL